MKFSIMMLSGLAMAAPLFNPSTSGTTRFLNSTNNLSHTSTDSSSSLVSVAGIVSNLFNWKKKPTDSYPPEVVLPNNDKILGILDDKFTEAFKGIPFADPPIGDLRFRHPVPYSGSLNKFKANEYGPSCVASHFLGLTDPTKKFLEMVPPKLRPALLENLNIKQMDEDCLTINVLRPKGTKPSDNLPVIVWIYGGAYQFGAASMYPGNKYIRDSIDMDQKVIFVSFNYRMGPFGFLGGEAVNEEGSTNAGLYDQRLALEWVSHNIASFGGNPDHVVAMGESAGAISIAHHLVSNNGDLKINEDSDKKLFHAAIFQSGGAWSFDSVTSSRATDAFYIFAHNAKCIEKPSMDTMVSIQETNSEKEILECLRNKGIKELMMAQNFDSDIDTNEITTPVQGFTQGLTPWKAVFGFSPRYDGKLIHGNPMELMAQGKFPKDIPIITGNQEDEGTILASLFEFHGTPDVNNLMHKMFEHATSEQFKKIVEMYKEDHKQNSEPKSKIGELLSSHKRFATIVNDVMFQAPRRLHLQNTADVSDGGAPRYVYQSTFLRNKMPVFGTMHSSELLWQFYLDFNPAPSYRRYFISFANHFDPNMANTGKYEEKNKLEAWPLYTNKGKETLNIGMRKNEESRDVFARDANIQYFVEHPEAIQI
ncbi:uncharacterized protein SAPINGB_P000454 [Magnusiomyces paraingens]|uniref:Carboxylesterase type B domain-containing protein n=1 Tax=Magnusiomyces paraingens TaxID=2606893 RepID=A0A5E8B6U9_9ASCO|nr:uncharacterized protein SAPINGB_P000454 [Saprochaete ingens]VVT44551.1 unnamed protein product [Saprochaete ingens]